MTEHYNVFQERTIRKEKEMNILGFNGVGKFKIQFNSLRLFHLVSFKGFILYFNYKWSKL